jgi:hypothetical protein
VPGFANPQALNRYSYCFNNPLKYIDPTGFDYVVVLGSGEEIHSDADTDYWYDWVHSNFPVEEGEICIFIPDTDPENIFSVSEFKFYDVTPRLSDLNQIIGISALTDIKLVGYSEGAATVAAYLSNTSSINDNLTAAFMLERPTWPLPGYNPLINVPEKLKEADLTKIILADIWNNASIVHNSPISNWLGYSHPYDSRSSMEMARTAALGNIFGISIDSIAFFNTYHGDIVSLHNEHLMVVSYTLLGVR